MSNDGHTDVDKWDRDLTKHVVALRSEQIGQPKCTRYASAAEHPVGVGRFPFAFSMAAPVDMLPTNIVTEVLPEIDVAAEFGHAPDVNDVDAHVRQMMREGLNNLVV